MPGSARRVWAAALVATALAVAHAGPCSELLAELQFPHCMELGPEPGVYSLAWQTDADNIWFALDLTTDSATAWAGIGLSEGGGMKGADLFVVAKQATGLSVQDLWSEQFALPMVDSSQDVVLVAPLAAGQTADAGTPTDVAARMTEKPGHLRALLRRKLNTCDTRDLHITSGMHQPVVWAYGEGWPMYHGTSTRGDTSLNFVPLEGDSAVPAAAPSTLPPNTYTLDIQMPNITIPTNTTSYLCSHFHLPDDKKYHIIAQEGIINSPLVHHIILFACTGPQPATGDVVDCLVNEPQCSEFVLGWAPGTGYVEYPKEAGFPMGLSTPEDKVPNWFSLQIHYTNPEGIVSAAPDTSGMRITYTSDLRPHDAGILSLTQLNLRLPAAKSTVIAPATICPAECTSKLEKPVTMLYTLMHMHQTGVSISTRHIRDGVELPPLGRRRVWDFNYQIAAPIPLESRELRPGDSLITQCTYNTVGRTQVTRFGQSTLDEMCFNFVVYYPKQRFQLCFSNPTMDMGGHKMKTATCMPAGAGADIADPQQRGQYYFQNGYITNVTWPTFTKFVEPGCAAVAAQSLGV